MKRIILSILAITVMICLNGFNSNAGSSVNNYGASGFMPPHYSEYLIPDGAYSSKSITIEWYNENSITPTGTMIYRKKGNGKYRLLTTIYNKNDEINSYKDKKVKKGCTYTYKLRFFVTRRGRTTYSDYSETFTRCAVNSTGKFKIKLLNADNPEEQIIALTSNKNNGNIKINTKTVSVFYDYYIKNSDPIIEEDLKLTYYSTDNTNWKKAKKKVTLKPGKTLYLKLSPYNGSLPIAEDITGCKEYTITFSTVNYNSLSNCALKLNMKKKTGQAYPDGEYYH